MSPWGPRLFWWVVLVGCAGGLREHILGRSLIYVKYLIYIYVKTADCTTNHAIYMSYIEGKIITRRNWRPGRGLRTRP
ncbi:hypothetical protein CO2235_MP70217 [Cupriavidus oxalaticus]|uniref:Uncharacterized protein n=1 Tax=Cupriavidus oxalaticus TaxID=96344 RepID=A0A976GDI7_9BURK|nr:hypothetical protein CO2235_MP70217 [Cupriavidus oxalaticus]